MGLRTRFALQYAATAALAVAVAVGASLAVFSLRIDATTAALGARFEAALERRLLAEGEAALEATAEAAKPLLMDYDRMGLSRLAMDAMATTGARAVRIYDGFGRTVADGGGDPAAFERPAPSRLRGLGPGDGPARWREGETLWSGDAVCVGGDCIGSVAVGVDGSEIARARAEADGALAEAKERFWWEAGALGFGGMLVGATLAALIGLLMARRFVATLRGAIDALGRLAKGETDVTVEARDAQLAELTTAVESVAEAMEAAVAGGASPEQAAALADMADGLFVAALDGRLVLANPALHDMLGAPEGALEGADAFDALGAARAEGAEAMARSFAAVRALTRADGSTLPVLISAKPTEAGVETRVVGVARDMADQTQAAAALQDAELRAEAADKAKAQFLAVMSHELRTPLNGILGGAAVLAGTELDDTQRGFLKIVNDSGRSLLSTVTDILNFARADDAKSDAQPEADPLDRAPTDLEDIAHEIAAQVAADAARKDLDLYVRVTPGAPVVMTDGEKMVELGRQLAENAVKFTDAGHVGVSITQSTGADGLAEITLSVEDSGPGVPPEAREAILEPFSQGDASERRAHGGTGLGLSIAKRLAEQLGGALAIDDADGGGAAFHVRFNAPIEGEAAPPRADLAGMRALVVDPAPGAREGLADQLGWGGAEAATADGPQAAAAALRRAQEEGRPFDLVVHPHDMLETPGAREFKDWIVGDGWSQGVASVALRPEQAPLETKELPQRMQTAPWPAPTGALIDAAAAATKAAGFQAPAEAEAKPKAPPPPSEAEAPKPAPAQPNRTPMVLLADSNEVNRIVLSAFLGKTGRDCAPAGNGREALDLFRSRRPTLVLMDVGMSEMTGVEAAKAMRRIEQEQGGAPIPIIGLVGKAREGERERLAQAGFNDFLPKPVKTAELEAKLERWTTLFGPEAEPARAAAS